MVRIDVKNYGAIGDGRSDDTDAVKVALRAGAGCEVFFPKGTYSVRPGERFLIPKDAKLKGEGIFNTRISTGGQGGYCLSFENVFDAEGIDFGQVESLVGPGVNLQRAA